MMTLLLTSSGHFVTEQASKILSKPLDKMKIAYVTTASKVASDLGYLNIRRKRMKELNYDFEEVDIEGKTLVELEEIFKDKEVVYVEGGNAFYLLKAMKESGFDKLIKNLVDEGVIYIGSSAGSYVACPTIEMSHWKIPGKEPREDYGLKDLSALNFVPFLLKAHYIPGWKDVLNEISENSPYPVRLLNDQQAFYVRDDKIELVGEGDEIII